MKQPIGPVALARAFTWTVIASQEPAATKPQRRRRLGVSMTAASVA
jgi:hypothetical protein